MFRSKRVLATGLALGLLATACSDDLSESTTSNGSSTTPTGSSGSSQSVTLSQGEFALTSGLATFGDCDALLTHLRTEGAERVTAWGFNDGNYWGGPMRLGVEETIEMDGDAMDDAGGDGAAPATTTVATFDSAEDTASAKTEGEDFSGTNNQERGVDEPDIVKTDGERILTVTNGTFSYTDANDGEPTSRDSVMVGYSVQDMLVHGDKVFLFGMSWGEDEGGIVPLPAAAKPVASGDSEADFAADSDVARLPGPGFYSPPRVRIIELDISDPDNIDATNQLLVDGFYLSARLVDGRASVAIQSDPRDLGFLYPQGEKGEERALAANRDIVKETELSDWLPNYILDLNGEESSGQLTSCTGVHAPTDFAGFGSLSVFTINANSGLETPQAASVLASGQNVYASTEAMWISTNRWIDWSTLSDEDRMAQEQSYSTQIHGFSINSDSPSYVASGSVRGHLLNQFAMSQQGDVLRVASTDGSMWGANESSESFITTLTIDGTDLVQTGQVGNMGKGERIFSVRFVGNTAYVVTFRQTDPFYTIDLTDPANPEVLGELKITGYSGQLHPLSETLILGIGQEATEEGRTTGAKITLFDVSDLSNPTDLDTWTAPNSWTGAEWDHKAFLWWPQESLAVLPIQNWQEQFWGAVAFRIDTEAGTIEEAGRLSHEPDQADKVGTTDCRVLTVDDLEEYRDGPGDLGQIAQEAVWMAEDGGQLQVCGDDEGGATGLYCERITWLDTSELDLNGELEMCWPEGPGNDPIVRTLVIGDTLWSLSWSRLQANDLQTFQAGPYVELR